MFLSATEGQAVAKLLITRPLYFAIAVLKILNSLYKYFYKLLAILLLAITFSFAYLSNNMPTATIAAVR